MRTDKDIKEALIAFGYPIDDYGKEYTGFTDGLVFGPCCVAAEEKYGHIREWDTSRVTITLNWENSPMLGAPWGPDLKEVNFYYFLIAVSPTH